MTAVTRWTVSVSRDTYIAVSSFLAQRGMKKGKLSKFIEEWRVLDETIEEVRSKFDDLPADELEPLLSDAIAAARRDRFHLQIADTCTL